MNEPDSTSRSADDVRAVRQTLEDGAKAFANCDIEGAMRPYAKDAHIFDFFGEREETYQTLYDKNKSLIDAVDGAPLAHYEDMHIEVHGEIAYARYLLIFSATLKDGSKMSVRGRGTDIMKKRDGAWRTVHEHFSVPVDIATGKANFGSER